MSGFVVVSCGFDVSRLDPELPQLEHFWGDSHADLRRLRSLNELRTGPSAPNPSMYRGIVLACSMIMDHMRTEGGASAPTPPT